MSLSCLWIVGLISVCLNWMESTVLDELAETKHCCKCLECCFDSSETHCLTLRCAWPWNSGSLSGTGLRNAWSEGHTASCCQTCSSPTNLIWCWPAYLWFEEFALDQKLSIGKPCQHFLEQIKFRNSSGTRWPKSEQLVWLISDSSLICLQ